MDGVSQFFSSAPAWTGSLPMWGLFITFVIALIKTWPIIQKNLLDARENRETRYGKRIKDLEEAVQDCRDQCDRETGALQEELFGLRKQHIQEQISFARAIISTIGSESPHLTILLSALENGQRSLEASRKHVEQVGEIKGDKKTEGNG